jgi:hypothetical protein
MCVRQTPLFLKLMIFDIKWYLRFEIKLGQATDFQIEGPGEMISHLVQATVILKKTFSNIGWESRHIR